MITLTKIFEFSILFLYFFQFYLMEFEKKTKLIKNSINELMIRVKIAHKYPTYNIIYKNIV